jgi:exonuclease SbcC
MIPIKLKLRNFMTYRDAALDFQGIHLAVLTGSNGAGKSTLLDAITWTLWGRARAKRDDELIHLGQLEMEVEYTFGLNDNTYRIVRKRDSSKRGRSDLAFFIEEAGGWRTLTETSLRITQVKINQLMRLDYETFVNSAFLLQGQADAFTVKPPGKRKEILSDILGLSIYDTYVERAKQRANAKEHDEAGLVAKIAQIEEELAREPTYRAELTAAQQEAQTLGQQLQTAEETMLTLREEHRLLNDKQRQLDDLRHRLRGAEADIADSTEAITAAQAAITGYRATLSRRPEIEAGLAELSAAKAAAAEWEHRLHESARLSKQQYELDRAINAARAKLEAELRGVSTKVDLLSRRANEAGRQREELSQARAALSILQTVQDAERAGREQLTALKEEAARLQEQNHRLKLEMDKIKARLTQLEQAGSECPICRRPLDEAHRVAVLTEYQQDGSAKGDLFRANRERLQEITAGEKSLQQQAKEAEQKLRSLASVQGKVATLERALAEAEAAAIALAAAQAEQAALQQQLDRQEFALEIIAQLGQVEAELAALGYDRAGHEQARAEVATRLHFEREGLMLEEAAGRLPAEETRLTKEEARRSRLLEQTATDRQTIGELETHTRELPLLSARLNQASAQVDTLQYKERLARDKVAAANQKLHHLTYLAKQRSEHEQRLEQLRYTLGLYRELQTAFGKRGVQALLIEEAIPEIEDEANKLLSQMTNNQTHIRFETVREARRDGGGAIETLDILISDQVGTRDYFLYSGGEAFRVNFAIRVALSKILARRAGARLQTLVIDEGFGTQDTQGRERLVEAITAIQDDFERIIVITHIEELKDAFPVQITVSKTDAGSRVMIQ